MSEIDEWEWLAHYELDYYEDDSPYSSWDWKAREEVCDIRTWRIGIVVEDHEHVALWYETLVLFRFQSKPEPVLKGRLFPLDAVAGSGR